MRFVYHDYSIHVSIYSIYTEYSIYVSFNEWKSWLFLTRDTLIEHWLQSFARSSWVAGSILSSCDIIRGGIYEKRLMPHAMALTK